MYGYRNKKSVGLVLVTRLTIRGSGLPIGVERATQKPHAEYDIQRYTTLQALYSDIIHIHKTSTIASSLTPIEIFQISNRQERERK